MKKLTPVIVIEEIEPVLPFWTDRLGFQMVASVPEGERMGFVILAKDNIEVMYQTLASLRKDVPALATSISRTNLFIEVEALDPILPTLDGCEVTVPLRNTFYGSREFGVRAPCGTCVTFAEFPRTEET
jgi:uncharacterized glyoxalase superfamily protein PhnB